MVLGRYPEFTQSSLRRLLELHRWTADAAAPIDGAHAGTVRMAHDDRPSVLLPFHGGAPYGPLLGDALLEAAGLTDAPPVLRAVPDELTIEVHLDEDGSSFATLRGHVGFFTSGSSADALEGTMAAMLALYFGLPEETIEATPRTQLPASRLEDRDHWVMVR